MLELVFARRSQQLYLVWGAADNGIRQVSRDSESSRLSAKYFVGACSPWSRPTLLVERCQRRGSRKWNPRDGK